MYKYDSEKKTSETDQTSADFGPVGWRRLGSDIDGEEPAGPVPDSHGDFLGFWRALRNLHHSAARSVLVFDSRGLQALLRMVVARYSTFAQRAGNSRFGTCCLIDK